MANKRRASIRRALYGEVPEPTPYNKNDTFEKRLKAFCDLECRDGVKASAIVAGLINVTTAYKEILSADINNRLYDQISNVLARVAASGYGQPEPQDRHTADRPQSGRAVGSGTVTGRFFDMPVRHVDSLPENRAYFMPTPRMGVSSLRSSLEGIRSASEGAQLSVEEVREGLSMLVGMEFSILEERMATVARDMPPLPMPEDNRPHSKRNQPHNPDAVIRGFRRGRYT